MKSVVSQYRNSYIPTNDEGRVLGKFFKEFPWLWALSSDWSGLLLIKVHRADPGIVEENLGCPSFASTAGIATTTFWLKAWGRDCNLNLWESVKRIETDDWNREKGENLTYLVRKAFRQLPPECELEFLISKKEFRGYTSSAMHDGPCPSHEYNIFKPPLGDKGFRGFAGVK
ncbi:MAG: hypothetical protein V4467_00870 [Patescibacteria group bacterium]